MFYSLKTYFKSMNTKVYNLIILDESGSMGCIRSQAVEGVNQTFNTIRQAQLSNEDQNHMVTLVTFDSERTNTIYETTPIKDVKDLSMRDYNPGACTPLYDAMGFSLTKLRSVATKDDLVLVTIITDGYENASHEYTGKAIKALVDELRKEQDWVFTYIGANQDVESVAEKLGVSSSMAFQEDIEGTRRMFERENACRTNFYNSCSCIVINDNDSDEAKTENLREAKRHFSRKFFDFSDDEFEEVK